MTPRTRRTGTLITLAVLLAFISTGSLTICDALIYGEPIDEGTTSLSVKAGEEITDFTGAQGIGYRFSVCPPTSLPDGVYFRIRRDLRGFGSASVDLVTTTDAVPGQYMIPIAESEFDPVGGALYIGILDLTVLPPDVNPLEACFRYYSTSEYFVVGHPITFDPFCSEASETNPIVQYKWWFNYNGNPNSNPDQTLTTLMQTQHTYTSAGQKTVRLVVHAQNGDEAATAQTLTVHGL